MLPPDVTACSDCGLFTGATCPFARRHAPPGTALLGQGEGPTVLAYVRAGAVALSAVAEDGTQTWAAIRGPRSLIGLEATSGETAPCEARTLTETELCVASAAAVAAFAQQPGGAQRLLALAVRELKSQRHDLELRTGPVGVRVARFLLGFERLVSPHRVLSKAEIAALLGVRAETLSRVLRRFAARGWLASAASLAIRDRAGLARAARG